MARDLSIVLADKEDIISYECNFASKIINVLVGVGNIDSEGNFIVQPSQTYKHYSITGNEYDTLMAANEAKPANVFRKEDLWNPIDIKNAELSEKLVEIAIVKDPKVKS